MSKYQRKLRLEDLVENHFRMGLGAVAIVLCHDYIFIGKRLPILVKRLPISSEISQNVLFVAFDLVVAPFKVVLEGNEPKQTGDCDDREQAEVCPCAHLQASVQTSF